VPIIIGKWYQSRDAGGTDPYWQDEAAERASRNIAHGHISEVPRRAGRCPNQIHQF